MPLFLPSCQVYTAKENIEAKSKEAFFIYFFSTIIISGDALIATGYIPTDTFTEA